MKFIQILFLSLTMLLAGCIGPKPDEELKTKISELIETNKGISVTNTLGLVSVNIFGDKAFEMNGSDRHVLADKLVTSVLKMRPETKEILISFAKSKPEIKLISYKWKNKEGELIVIQ